MSQLGLTVGKLLQIWQAGTPNSGCVSGWKPLSHITPACPIQTKVLLLTNMWTE